MGSEQRACRPGVRGEERRDRGKPLGPATQPRKGTRTHAQCPRCHPGPQPGDTVVPKPASEPAACRGEPFKELESLGDLVPAVNAVSAASDIAVLKAVDGVAEGMGVSPGTPAEGAGGATAHGTARPDPALGLRARVGFLSRGRARGQPWAPGAAGRSRDDSGAHGFCLCSRDALMKVALAPGARFLARSPSVWTTFKFQQTYRTQPRSTSSRAGPQGPPATYTDCPSRRVMRSHMKHSSSSSFL